MNSKQCHTVALILCLSVELGTQEMCARPRGPSLANGGPEAKEIATPTRTESTKPALRYEDTRAIALRTIEDLGASAHHDYALMEDQTVERPFGWVFFYSTREYVATRDRSHLVPGTAPFVVNRFDGSVVHLPTSVSPARAIELYEAQWLEGQARKP